MTSRACTALALLAACAAALPARGLRAEDVPDEVLPAPYTDVSWYVIPNVGVDSDDGLGFGARAELADKTEGYAQPYRVAYVLHGYATLRGYHHHRLRYDRTGMGPGGRLRFTLHVAWRQWLNDRYFGVGNATVREAAFADDAQSDAARGKRYRYTLFQPFIYATTRATLDGPWRAFASTSVRWSEIRTYRGSLLAEQQPFGMDGGLTAEVHGGLLFDTRYPEADPREGVLLELSGRYAPPVDAGTGHFGGVLASARGFLAPADRLVLGARLSVEWLLGRVPFYEMNQWGGAIPVAGFGGSETLRGVSFGRWRGPGKAIVNTEARIVALSHELGGKPFDWHLVPFLDAGLAFDTADAFEDFGHFGPLHPGAGLGVRAVYDHAFVGRLDFGLSEEVVEDASGSRRSRVNPGFYLVFDHTF